MKKITRRSFIGSTLMGGAAAAALGSSSWAATHKRAKGANDAIRLGFIGLRSRGAHSIGWFRDVPGVRIAAVCDPDREFVGREVVNCLAHGESVRAYTDLRELLDDKSIDAVVLSMPVQWHALAAIWACQAGKDVYVEKPVSHNIWEGRKLVEAARKYNRIVQGGTQFRSSEGIPELKEYIASGALGKPLYVRGSRYGVRDPIGKVNGPQPIPDNVDYNLWCGPAPMSALTRENLHYDWHWVWDTGSGEMGNWAVHIIDDIRNTLGDPVMPRRCVAGGGRVVWDDDGETPNVQFAYYETDSIPVVFDLRNISSGRDTTVAPQYRGVRSGFVLQCENGYFAGGRGAAGWSYDKEGNRIKQILRAGDETHGKNFIDAIRSRRREDLHADVEVTHYSSAWCHLANMSCRLGSRYSKEEALERVRGRKEWADVIDGVHEHMAAHGVNINQLKIGPVLEVDPWNETLVGASATPEALAMLRRRYRAPFVVPDGV